MKQGEFFRSNQERAIERAGERKAISTFWKRNEDAEKNNIAAARIIMEDPEKYEGGLLQWAKYVLTKRGLFSSSASTESPALKGLSDSSGA